MDKLKIKSKSELNEIKKIKKLGTTIKRQKYSVHI
jgi:hypothetical protein